MPDIFHNILAKDPSYWGLDFATYNDCRHAINQAIREYNQATQAEDRKLALQNMQAAIAFVDLKTLPSVLAKANDFWEIKKILFPKLKAAYAENGVKTLLKAGQVDSPLARIVSDMSPEKADQLRV